MNRFSVTCPAMLSMFVSPCGRHQHARDALHRAKPRLCPHQTVTARPPSLSPRHPLVYFCPCEFDSSGGLAEVMLGTAGPSVAGRLHLASCLQRVPPLFMKKLNCPGWGGAGDREGRRPLVPSPSPPPISPPPCQWGPCFTTIARRLSTQNARCF